MKKSLFLLSVLLVSGCGHKEFDSSKSVQRLIGDFLFAEQTIRMDDPTFAVRSEKIGLKRYPCIVQHGNGRISFYVQLKEEPKLEYTLHWAGQPGSDPDARIVVETDFPDFFQREYRPKFGVREQIDLIEFQARAVRISFSADNPLTVPILWVEPTVEQTVRKNPVGQTTLAAVENLRQRQRNHNVLIFLLDAARPLHFGSYGYSKPTTPTIDVLAREGVIFENAFTQAVYTIASTGSLFTGLYPDVHQVLYRKNKLPDQFKTMAEYLQEVGFRTDMFSANGFGGPNFGYGQGFTKVWKLWYNPSMANAFVPAVTSWLKEVSNRRFFGYVHFREPHEPYRPPAEYLARFNTDLSFEPLKPPRPWTDEEKKKMVAAYDANLAYVDEQLGRILEYMRTAGLMERTVIFILSDHGESFWEHGARGHDTQVYEEMIRIPFIVRFPNEAVLQGVRKSQMVGTIDVLPTLMDLYGISQRGVHIDGRSILPLLVNDNHGGDRFLITRTNFEQAAYSLRTSSFKFIYHLKPLPDELYLLDSDPDERNNLSEIYPILASFYRTELRKRLQQMDRSKRFLRVTTEQAIIDPETEESLRALGYVN